MSGLNPSHVKSSCWSFLTYIGQDKQDYGAVTNNPKISVAYYNKGLSIVHIHAVCLSWVS